MHSELHYAELPTLFFKFRGTEQQVTEDARCRQPAAPSLGLVG